MQGPKVLLQCADNWEAHVGGWVPGERVVFRGRDLHKDLGGMSWMELYVYSITGRRFSENQIKMLNAIWVNTSFPEARIWNNRVVALGGTVKSTASLAMAAGIAVSDAALYGQPARIRASDFFWRAKTAMYYGECLETLIDNELTQHKIIYGYGRPMVDVDERIPHLMVIARNLNLDSGEFVQMAFEVEKILTRKNPKAIMHSVGLAAAFTADMGFTAQEYCMYCAFCFAAGMMPCFLDASTQKSGTFLPMRCGQLQCENIRRRSWS